MLFILIKLLRPDGGKYFVKINQFGFTKYNEVQHSSSTTRGKIIVKQNTTEITNNNIVIVNLFKTN